VQTTGHLVAVAAKLSAGVQHGEHHFECTLAFVWAAWVWVDWNAAAVVGNRAGAVFVQRNDHLGAIAGHGLVYCVVDHFPDEVMQTSKTGGTDVHAGAFANRVETFKNLDVFRAISGGAGCCRLCGFAGGHQLLATGEDGKNEELRGINNTLKSTNYFVRVLRFTRTSMPTMVLAVADESDASSCGSRNLICVAHDASSTSTCNR